MTQQKARRRVLALAIAAAMVAVVLGVVALHAAWRQNTLQADARAPIPGVVTSSTAYGKLEGAAPPAPLGNDSSISSVPLPMILTGTMPGRNALEGSAFLGVSKDSPQTYVAGALLANGALLAEIYPTYIVLKKDGKTTRLYLQGVQPGAASTPLNDLVTVGGARNVAPAAVTDRDVLTDYIRPSPVYDGEVLKGYQVYPGQKSGVFSQLGLRNGDVITALNDAPFSDPKQAIDLLQQIAHGAVMGATLERQGKIEHVTLDGSLIASAEGAPK